VAVAPALAGGGSCFQASALMPRLAPSSGKAGVSRVSAAAPGACSSTPAIRAAPSPPAHLAARLHPRAEFIVENLPFDPGVRFYHAGRPEGLRRCNKCRLQDEFQLGCGAPGPGSRFAWPG